MNRNKTLEMGKKMFFTYCAITALVTVSYARQEGGEKGEPPKEAIEVCVGQEAGTSCTMNTPRGSLIGECKNTPDKKYFVCMPEGGPDKH